MKTTQCHIWHRYLTPCLTSKSLNIVPEITQLTLACNPSNKRHAQRYNTGIHMSPSFINQCGPEALTIGLPMCNRYYNEWKHFNLYWGEVGWMDIGDACVNTMQGDLRVTMCWLIHTTPVQWNWTVWLKCTVPALWNLCPWPTLS